MICKRNKVKPIVRNDVTYHHASTFSWVSNNVELKVSIYTSVVHERFLTVYHGGEDFFDVKISRSLAHLKRRVQERGFSPKLKKEYNKIIRKYFTDYYGKIK
jgi:hypothetical protein